MFRRPNNVSCRYTLSKGTGKTNTRQYNLKFKNRSYFMVTLTCCKGIKVFFQMSAVRTGVLAYMHGRYDPGIV